MRPTFERRVWWTAGLCAIVAAGAAFWLMRAAPAAAPPVEIVTLRGERVALNALRGKVVLVNFWATDCSVCLQEMSMMASTYQKFHTRGFEAIFIAMPHDRPDHVLHYTQSQALPFRVALDISGELNRSFGGVKLTPTTFIIDKRGMIVARIVGEPSVDRLHALIERELAGRG